MRVSRLELIAFRNQEARTIEPAQGVTIFTGDNGRGKTNLLEAVYVASIGRSFRTQQGEDLISFDRDEGAVLLDFSLRQVVHRMKVRLRRGESARFFLNETRVRRKDLLGTFRTVLFTPDELRLIKGAPQERRHFLDLEVSQVSPRYYEELLRYSRAVQQRNAELRQAQLRGRRPDIDMWDMQIARGAAYLTGRRLASLARMNELLRETEEALTGGSEGLSIEYQLAQGEAAPHDEGWYLQKLAESREEDCRLCRTSVGPHRDDLLFMLNGRNLARFGSQGQQRTAILAMKLAEAAFIRRETGEYPVLLMDDMGSELDEGRRRALFGYIGERDIQTLVTSVVYPSGVDGMEVSV